MNSKVFAQRFNRELILLGLPEELHDKIKAVSKVFGLSRHAATSFIFGYSMPDAETLKNIAQTLEVCPKWLIGAVDKKKAYAEA